MRIGIVGTGRMAYARVRCVSRLPDVRLAWVCSRSSERAQRLINAIDETSRTAETEVYADIKSALDDTQTDSVIITSPNAIHFQDAREVFSAGVSVFLEYPPAVTPTDADILLALAKDSGVSYMIGLTYLYNGKHIAIARLCREEADVSLGRPRIYQHVVCTGNPISRWYNDEDLSGGMFVSSMFSYIDSVIDFFGVPDMMNASYHADRDTNGIILSDNASIQMSFASGCAAQMSYARGMKKPGIGSRRLIIFERGYLIDDDAGTRILTQDKTSPFEFETHDALLEESGIFIDSIRSGGGIDKTVEHAQQSLKIAWDAREQSLNRT